MFVCRVITTSLIKISEFIQSIITDEQRHQDQNSTKLHVSRRVSVRGTVDVSETRWLPAHMVVMDYKYGGWDHARDCATTRAAKVPQKDQRNLGSPVAC